MSTEPNQDPLARVRQLEREVDELRDRYERTEGMLNGLLQRGLKDMLVSHGAQEFGGGTFRLERRGVVFSVARSEDAIGLFSGAGGGIPAIYFLRSFDSDLNASTEHGVLEGEITSTGVTTVYLAARVALGVAETSPSQSTVTLIRDTNPSAGLSARSATGALGQITVWSANGDESYVLVNANSLYLPSVTVDPASLAANDSAIWYRSDTDVFHGRANGVTETFAFESDVVLLTNASWTDLTDGGATVLHTHAASGGTDPHPFLLMGA